MASSLHIRERAGRQPGSCQEDFAVEYLGGKSMRFWGLVTAVILAAWVAGCGGTTTPAVITITPLTATVIVDGTQQFSATVSGSSTTTVNWQVCLPAVKTTLLPTNCTALPSTPTPPNPQPKVPLTGFGTITQATANTPGGLYTAPATIPSPNNFVILATSSVQRNAFSVATVTIDSGVRVQILPTSATMGTLETLTFTATVSGSTETAVAWSVNGIANGDSTTGTIMPTGPSTAQFTAPNAAGTETVTATLANDPTQSASTTVSVVAAATPSLVSIDPTVVEQGSVQQDIYLIGTNFLTTTTVAVGNPPITVTPTLISNSLMRATVPSAAFTAAAANTQVLAVEQGGNESQPQFLNIVPVRPVVVSSSPDSVSQNQSNVSVNLTGGFFSPSVCVQFNGQTVAQNTGATSRQMTVTIPAGSLSTPGLYPIITQLNQTNSMSSCVPATGFSISAVNLAVEPSLIPGAPNAPIAVGTNPSAVAIDPSGGLALVANAGNSTTPSSVSLIDMTAATPDTIGTISCSGANCVGNNPTGIAVDDMLTPPIALVVNSADNTVTPINLSTSTVYPAVALPSGTVPYSIGINPLTHRALVANQSTNLATILDISISSGAPVVSLVSQIGGNLTGYSTGQSPAVGIDPRLNWAIVTAGGAGTTNFVDLGRDPSPGDPAGRAPLVIGSLSISTSLQGIGINPETHLALLADPNTGSLSSFSLLDNTVNTIPFTSGGVTVSQFGYRAAAANPLTNVGVAVNSNSSKASVVDLENNIVLQTVTVGTLPVAVAIDQVSNQAVIVNQGDGTVSILPLGPIRSLHIVEADPAITFAPAVGALTLTIAGGGFVPGSQVLLDGVALPAGNVNVVSARQIIATVPANMLAGAWRYTVTVQNAGPAPNVLSNATDLTVVQPIVVGTSPVGVAVDTDRDLAVVSNSADGTATLISLAPLGPDSPLSQGPVGTIGLPVLVGTNPQGVATLPRLGLAAVANNGSSSMTILDVTSMSSPQTVGPPLCGSCSGSNSVTIDQDTAIATVTMSTSSNVASVNMLTGALSGGTSVDMNPTGVAIDPNPNLNYTAVATDSQASSLVFLSGGAIVGRISNLQIPGTVVFDPVNQVFLVADSAQNNIVIADPSSFVTTSIRGGINPTALDYNFQTSSIVTVNAASHTMSVIDYVCPPTTTNACPDQQVRTILGLGGSQPASSTVLGPSSVAIDPKLNLAVLVDPDNNRVLLVPLPH